MGKMVKRYLNNLWMMFVLVSCIEPYTSDSNSPVTGYLVVDGFLDTSGEVNVTLTRTVALSNNTTPPPEAGALVQLHASGGSTFALADLGSGKYLANGIAVDPQQQYWLSVQTADGEAYASNAVTIKETPEIDSVSWDINITKDVEIKVHTHDDTKLSRYYKWDYVETWEYLAPFNSSYIKVGNTEVRFRSAAERIYLCYQTKLSTDINIATSSRSVSDEIRNQLIKVVPAGSPALQSRYSILVKQRALSQEAYTYWKELEKSTETLGTLFDPLPGTVLGNMHSTSDEDLPVVGYFDAGNVTTKRLFISYLELTTPTRGFRETFDCIEDYVDIENVQILGPQNYITTSKTFGLAVLGYYYTTKKCADCQFQGGVLTKPDFW